MEIATTGLENIGRTKNRVRGRRRHGGGPHGSIRATLDADALVSLGMSRLLQLERVFKRGGLHTELRRGDADDPIPALLGISDQHGNRVDLLAGLRGLDVEAFSRSIIVPFLGSSLRVVSLEDFIPMKCLARGPLDIVDARHALQTAAGPIDIDLLRRLRRASGVLLRTS